MLNGVRFYTWHAEFSAYVVNRCKRRCSQALCKRNACPCTLLAHGPGRTQVGEAHRQQSLAVSTLGSAIVMYSGQSLPQNTQRALQA
jgi:hypothetical protein